MKIGWESLAAISIIVLLSWEAFASAPKNYVIAVLDNPKKLSPLKPESNTVEIHGSLLFYPLLRSSVKGYLSSELIDVGSIKAESRSFDEFTFCLRAGLRFPDSTFPTSEDLAHSLELVASSSPDLQIASVKAKSGNCALVRLASSSADFPVRLASARTALFKRAANVNGHPMAIGPYRLVRKEADSWFLEANAGFLKGNIKAIELRKVDYIKGVQVDALISDYNFMVGQTRPKAFVDKSVHYEIGLSKSYVLIARLKDESARRRVLGCLDIGFLREKINGAGLEFRLAPTKGLLVSSLPGADVSFEKETAAFRKDCASAKGSRKDERTVNWIVPHVAALKAFEESAAQLTKKTGLPVAARAVDRTLLWKILKDPDAEFIVMLGIESPRHSLSEFYDLFVGSGIIPKDPELEKKLKRVLSLPRKKQQEPASDLHRFAIKLGYTAPVGLATTSRYYPIGTKNLIWDERGNAIPRYESMIVPGF